MCPILELRGGLIAASLLGMNPWISYLICMVGNILPIPFILPIDFISSEIMQEIKSL